MNTNRTGTVGLVRNDKLHYAIDGSTSRCAGRRRTALPAFTVDYVIDLEVADLDARYAPLGAAVRELKARIAADPRVAPQLCERCAGKLAPATTDTH